MQFLQQTAAFFQLGAAEAYTRLGNIKDQTWEFMHDPNTPTLIAIVLLAMGVWLLWAGRRMTPQRDRMLKRYIEDGIVDVFENAEHTGQMSGHEKWIWYRRCADKLQLPGLMHRIPDYQKFIKKEIKGRLKTEDYKPVKLPDWQEPDRRTRLQRIFRR